MLGLYWECELADCKPKFLLAETYIISFSFFLFWNSISLWNDLFWLITLTSNSKPNDLLFLFVSLESLSSILIIRSCPLFLAAEVHRRPKNLIIVVSCFSFGCLFFVLFMAEIEFIFYLFCCYFSFYFDFDFVWFLKFVCISFCNLSILLLICIDFLILFIFLAHEDE